MKRLRIVMPSLVLIAATGALGPAAGEVLAPGSEPPAKSTAVPPAEKARKNPVPPVSEAIEAGRILFASQCHFCHGAKGDGKGELARELSLVIPDFREAKWQVRRTDGELFYITGHGHRAMPPEKRLADQQKWEMILYIRTLAGPPSSGEKK